jgi:Fe-S-cluster containining protein
MNIIQKAKAVEKLFQTLEKDINKLKTATGIHCVDSCIFCCTTPNIQATSLEFYPLAMHLYHTNQANLVLEKLNKINTASVCPVLNTLSIEGSRIGCSQYEHRGLICRLFAFNFNTNKYGIRQIAACKSMKINQPDAINKANQILAKKPLGPKASDYYSRLQFVDFTEAQNLYPIGEAIKLAIEKVITYHHYSGNKAM